MDRSTALSEHKLINRLQLRLIFLYIFAFLVFETAVIGSTHVILSHQIMNPMYQSIMDEWSQKTDEGIQQLEGYVKGDQEVHVDATPEVVASWVIAADGHVVDKDTTMTSAPPIDLAPFAQQLAQSSMQDTASMWNTFNIGGTYFLAGVKALYVNNQRIGTIVSFRSLTVVHETMESLTHIDIEIGLASILLVIPVTYWLANRSLLPVRTAMQRQRNFVNDAAHELRTPLSILHGTLELAQFDNHLETAQQAIREGLAETEYITDLISNLSTLARLESGVTQLNIRDVDMASLAQDTVFALEPLVEKRKIQLIGEGLTKPAMVTGDPTRLRQLLMILLDNAFKYTPSEGWVRVIVQKTRNDVEVRITDTGIGISEADLPRIFDRFYRATKAENHAGGSGIGLAIAAWIVEAHYGQILVQSKEGRGTTFRILLPRQGHGLAWKKVLHPKG